MEESQPLLRQISEPRHPTINDPRVDFDPDWDPENPLDWPKTYKLCIVSLLALMAFTVTFTCVGLVPVADRIVHDLEGEENRSASILLVTVWELGEACGPLLIAPLSEIYGRYPAFNVANLFFIIGVVLAALSPTTSLLIFARFLTGFAVASNVLNPAIIGDIFPSHSRGSGMSLVMLAPLVGGAIGPALSGVIAESLGWRTILWMSAIIAICCETLFFVFFRETYKVVILQRRAARLRAETKDESFKCAWESKEAATQLYWETVRDSIQRPMLMMWKSRVLKIMAFYGAMIFTFYYVLATTLPGILRERYAFSPAWTGYSFLSFSIGATAGIIICNLFLDRLYTFLGRKSGSHDVDGTPHPENRLPFLIFGALLMPITIFFYGFIPSLHSPSSQSNPLSLSISLFLITVALQGFFLLIISVSLASYIVDAFGLYSASAMTIVLIVRCLAGTVLPLCIPPLENALGLGGGFAVLAGISLVLVPLPGVVWWWGESWRGKEIEGEGLE
ncbi:hypothetical protein EG329_013585 [Mollisiaceae sp. DMI_Dod_QoI]|nr:hypothetical protein EG329_013585 [Helotiales sp. DMI_Dod_QoI]